MRVEIVDGRNVRMIELGKGQRFLAEALSHRGIGKAPGRQDLDGDIALQPHIAGAIDVAHASGADLLQNGVVPEALADHGDFRVRPS